MLSPFLCKGQTLGGGARARAPTGVTSRKRDTGTTGIALLETLQAGIVPLAVRREKHIPIQAVVFQVGTKEGGQGVIGSSGAGEK